MKYRQFINTLLVGFCLTLTLPGTAADRYITLASTTSTQNSGFFDYYLPLFQKKTGIEVRVVAVGTGQALKLGENGDADLMLVHDSEGEKKFVNSGHGIDRRQVMYNDFILVGPKMDPARLRGKKDAVQSLKMVANTSSLLVSRGDDSGTHRMEKRLWKASGIDPHVYGDRWYKEAGSGMGAVLNMAAASNAYTLSDRATWLSFQNRGGLALLVEGDPRLFNQYSLILVNPAKHAHVKKAEALSFMDWMVSKEGQQLISEFKFVGEVLFHPNAAHY